MNHGLAAAAELVQDQPSFFSILLKKLIFIFGYDWNDLTDLTFHLFSLKYLSFWNQCDKI